MSNRLPFSLDSRARRIEKSSGGLVTAISGIADDIPKLWVGAVLGAEAAQLWGELTTAEQRARHHPVFLDNETYDAYYNGTCNELLWPVFHYNTELNVASLHKWDVYRRVNEMFADELLKILQDGDLIWVHDYHLFLLPGLLRQRRPSARIGFFLHIPFPSSDVFRQLPVREEILQSLIQADLIGFHDYSYLRHFVNSVYAVLGIRSTLLAIEQEGHMAQLGVFPVSIDSRRFTRTASSRMVTRLMAKHSKKSPKHLVLGVDRLDYTKGVELKLEAFRQLLLRHPDLREQVRLLQIAVPTRIDSPDYIRLKADIDQLVGSINAEFSTLDWTPIKYLFSSIPFKELLALYRMAGALLVTSKRDGMNLVSLEYAAAQDPRNPGVIILSEFAGSSAVLNQALSVNPWDSVATAEALFRALTMPADERQQRHAATMSYLRQYSATDWATSFMKRLLPKQARKSRLKRRERLTPISLLNEIAARGPRPLLLLLDYDGTIVPIRRRPELAVLPDKSRLLLQSLTGKEGIDIVIISGRDRVFLEEQLGAFPVTLAAEHGAIFRRRGSEHWRNRIGADRKRWYALGLSIMSDYTKRTPGSFVEKKTFALAWHYRCAQEEFAEYQARNLRADMENAMAGLPVTVITGKKVVEVRAAEANKGAFLSWYISSTGKRGGRSIIAIGDDATDEEMFAVLPADAIAIRIGTATTCARYYVPTQRDAMQLLKAIDSSVQRPPAARRGTEEAAPETAVPD